MSAASTQKGDAVCVAGRVKQNTPESVGAALIGSSAVLSALIKLRKDADAKLADRQKNRPKDKQTIECLRSRRKGIQHCITAVVNIKKADNEKALP